MSTGGFRLVRVKPTSATVGAVIAVALAATVCAAAAPLSPAAAQPAQQCAPPGKPVNKAPWAQKLLAPERVWSFSRGHGMTVAVIDSGVDASHQQLSGRVSAGFDAVAGGGPANNDCLGTGTQVAGVIAARPSAAAGFVGMAPGVAILPVRVVDRPAGPEGVDPAVLARGIDWAVGQGADIITVSAVTYTPHPALRAAVAHARIRGAIVVAAAGDLGGANGADDRNRTPYPAAYEDVIGVGAIGPTGERWSYSRSGPHVDLVAPGSDIVTLQRESGMAEHVNGTGVACGFVAASATLAWAKRGLLTPSTEIMRVLLATAVPGPGGPEYGHGVVNPYAAVNDVVVRESPAPLPTLEASVPTKGDSAWAHSRRLAVAGAVLAVLAALAAAAGAVALPRGRRRFWRPVMAAPAPDAAPEEPGPPVLLFDERGDQR